MDIHEIKQALREGLVTIDYTKVNGERRRMVATLDSAVVPPVTSEQIKVRDPNNMVVWDTEHAGWRTVKVDSIREWVRGIAELAPEEPKASIIGAWVPSTQVPTSNT